MHQTSCVLFYLYFFCIGLMKKIPNCTGPTSLKYEDTSYEGGAWPITPIT